MSRAAWRNGLLLAAVAVLGVYAYFKPAREAPIEHALSKLGPQQITSIWFERPGSAPLLIERRRDGWHVAAPFRARADALRVHQMLSILEAKSAHRLPATDLARFELDRPVARVAFGGQTFSFGLVNEITREQYVHSGDTVYTVHPRYGAMLPTQPTDAASRQLFAADETPVRFELRDFAVEEREGRWDITPGARDLAQDDFARWVDEWQLVSALRVEPRGKGKSLSEIRVQLKNGGGFTVGVLARQPELVLARSDEELRYHLRSESALRLLAPPAAARSEPAGKK